MNQRLNRIAVPGLRWALGLVVLGEGCREFLHSIHAVHDHAHALPLLGMRLILSSGEIAAATLFLLPRTRVVGSYGLLVVLALAMGIHLARGDWGILSLSVYLMAVLVSLAQE
jgi:hypothetical protein